MYIRAKAPLRISLAGGGTDVSPYSDIYGGAILNFTINRYAYTTIEPTNTNKIIIQLVDFKTNKISKIIFDSVEELPTDHAGVLVAGVYNRVVRDYVKKPLSFTITLAVDAPPGSGLGTSSAVVVSILGAFAEWFKLPFGDYDLANLAYSIEREDLKMAGGKQDQYAATFGGANYMEFYENNKVIVNPLRLDDEVLFELSNNLVLYNTETSRLSSKIIESQQRNVKSGNKDSIEAMHKLKEQVKEMKAALFSGNLLKIGHMLHSGWQYKKQMADEITNPSIDAVYQTAIEAGAVGGKISGAGGGGFFFFYCPGVVKYDVICALNKMGGKVLNFGFTQKGIETWTYKNK
ncbi:MAG: dehydrogenase [Lentimicrobiaceae bacterium]|nr:dehydrogenase [Lentimicrobiaceae bacterium]